MILHALTRYYEALRKKGKAPSYGYSMEKASAMMVISTEGELQQFIPMMEEAKRGNQTLRVPQTREVPLPYVRTSGIQPNFLFDTTVYFTGIRENADAVRSKNCFEASAAFHKAVLQDCQGPVAQALQKHFDTWDPDKHRDDVLEQIQDLGNGFLVIEVSGHGLAHEDDEIRKAWTDYLQRSSSDISMTCLVSGIKSPVAVLHGKIKGVSGAQSSGGSLVGFNATSSESFCREQGQNAPVSELSAFAYVTALNYLLDNDRHRCRIGDSTVVFWTDNDDEQALEVLSSFMNPPNKREDDEKLRGLMDSIQQGVLPENTDLKANCHVLGLSPNAARISVRYYLQESLDYFLDNLRAHYRRLEIARSPYEFPYLSPYNLLAETVNPHSRDKAPSPLLAGALMRSILQNTNYPDALFKATLVRLRAQQDDKDRNIYKVTRGRAAIIKACMLKRTNNHAYKEVLVPMLNKESNIKPYVLGRMFSVLEEIQQKANPGINTTIKDRFFDTACTNPAVVFPQIQKLAMHHLSKIGEPGIVIYLEKKLGALMDKLNVEDTPYPKQLDLTEQGLFILGYYQQNQDRYSKKEDQQNV